MITAIGNPVYDYIKTQKVDTKNRILSGCSTNAVLALSKLGAETRLIGAIGNDYRQAIKTDLEKYGIKYDLIESEESGGFSLVYYDDFGNRTLDLLGRAATIDSLDPALYSDSEAVLIGPILKEVPFKLIGEIRSQFEGLLFCDPQGLLRGAKDDGSIYHEKPDGLEKTLGFFDIVKPNELEGKVLTGIDCREDPHQAAKIIKSYGPKIVIVTLAELGSLIYDGKEFIEIPPYEIDLVDATGAGDTYMAGFTFEYLKTKDLRKAGCFASCTSSVMIEQVGPYFEMSEQQVRSRQETLLAMSDFKLPVSVNG